VRDEPLEDWLNRMLVDNIDLRSPSKDAAREAKRLDKVAKVTMLEDGAPIGHLELERRAGAIEFCTVVVDPGHRGRGLSHELVRQGVERADRDPIVAGVALDDPDEQRGVLLFSFTRNAALAATLVAAGFKLRSPRRKWSTLWLIPSSIYNLPFLVRMATVVDRIKRNTPMLLRDRKRFWHQKKNLGDYHMFTLWSPDARAHVHASGEDFADRVDALGMDMVRVTEDSFHQDPASGADVRAWDEAE
jgi:GNAT superfamily N-acetyltransferase